MLASITTPLSLHSTRLLRSSQQTDSYTTSDVG